MEPDLLTHRRRLFAAVTVVALLVVAVGGYLFLTRASAGASATLTIFTGTASIKRNGSTTFAPAHSGESLGDGDTVQTGSGARAVINSGGGAQTRLEENTTIQVKALSKTNGVYQTDLQQTVGKTWSKVRRLIGGASFNLRGPNNATAGVRGTDFVVIVTKDAAGKPVVRIDTFSGTVVVKSSGRDVTVSSGFSTTVASDQKAQPVVPIPAGDKTDAFSVYNQALDVNGTTWDGKYSIELSAVTCTGISVVEGQAISTAFTQALPSSTSGLVVSGNSLPGPNGAVPIDSAGQAGFSYSVPAEGTVTGTYSFTHTPAKGAQVTGRYDIAIAAPGVSGQCSIPFTGIRS
jgi:hypothetical protein